MPLARWAATVTRRAHEATSTMEVYSPAEELFNRRRRTAGLFAGPIVLILLLAAPLPLAAGAHRLGAIMAMMVVFWVSEALPLAVTALVGPVLAILLGIAPARVVFAPFADPIIFLFIGSFMLAEAMFVHRLDRRIAFSALSSRAVGGSAVRILCVSGAVTAGISMWISNTATTAMMFPIGLSIVAHLTGGRESDPASRDFATAMMLVTAFAASIGGIGTPIGTPPNLIGIGMLQRIAQVNISFFEWMALGVPVVLVLFAFLIGYFHTTERHRLLVRLCADWRDDEARHRPRHRRVLRHRRAAGGVRVGARVVAITATVGPRG
jgi:solute carrier family 13 (sodium-dependent dicarboxylate transporter), member 2/3/5